MKNNNVIKKVTVKFYSQATPDEIDTVLDKLSNYLEDTLPETIWGSDKIESITVDKNKPLESGIDNDTLAYFGFTDYNYN